MQYASYLSNQVISSSSAVPAVRQQAAVDRRQTYLSIFDEQERVYDNARPPVLDWWKQPFIKSADLITSDLRAAARNQSFVQSPSTLFRIIHEDSNETYEFDASQQHVILIGRRAEADVKLTQTNGCSRLHAVIYLFPQLDKVLIVDVGSASGITMLQRRTPNAPLQHSTPSDRRNIELPFGESCKLQLGSQTIMLTPLECIVCLSSPRSCRLECGHFVSCDDCTSQLDSCPVCTNPINHQQVEKGVNALNSHAPPRN